MRGGRVIKALMPTGRRYIVYFYMGSALEGKYAVIYSSSREQALFDAVEKFGRIVARVEIENQYEYARIKFRGYTEHKDIK